MAVAHGTGPAMFDQVRAVADAVLYEGYVLYPYRRSSGKNRVRWQFGVLAPKAWLLGQGPVDETSVAGSVESWFQQTECLLEAPPHATVTVRVRFLQVQAKVAEKRTDGGYEPAGSVEADGRTYLSFDEALPREHDITVTVANLLDGRIVRRSWPVSADVVLSARAAATPFPVIRLRIRVENTIGSVRAGTPRDHALRQSLIATHTVSAVGGGGFLSMLDPPQWAASAARDCRNVHTFPVLAGAPGSDALVLSAPIILPDHAQVAPESPGDLHDGGEIDEILSLRTRTLTEAEKAEARATDPRTAAIIDRVDAMPPEMFGKLHGAIRSLRPSSPRPPAPEPSSPQPSSPQPSSPQPSSPQPDSVVAGGTRVTKGCRVRLRPRRHGTDAQDMFLAGRTATVNDILADVDGSQFVAVTLDDDPGGDLLGWYGRFYHFAPDESEVVR
jgi:hypothetical protein